MESSNSSVFFFFFFQMPQTSIIVQVSHGERSDSGHNCTTLFCTIVETSVKVSSTMSGSTESTSTVNTLKAFCASSQRQTFPTVACCENKGF